MNHIYILYTIAISIILILIYLTINISKEKFHEDYTTSYNAIKSVFKELNSNTINTKGVIYSMDKNNLPNGWGGGVRTYDIYASGKIGVGSDDNAGNTTLKSYINSDGSASFCNGQFTIDANGILTIRNKDNFNQKFSFYQNGERFTIAKADGTPSIQIYNSDDEKYQYYRNYLYFPYNNKWFGRDNRIP